jgi:hypothetical protein
MAIGNLDQTNPQSPNPRGDKQLSWASALFRLCLVYVRHTLQDHGTKKKQVDLQCRRGNSQISVRVSLRRDVTATNG